MLLREADCEALLLELASRYSALVVLGVHKENDEQKTEVLIGPAFMCLGLMREAEVNIEARLSVQSL